MNRTKALITAGTISGTLLAASTVYALTGAVADDRPGDGAGTLSPVATLVEWAGDPAPTLPVVSASTSESVTRSSASAVPGGSDDAARYDDDRYEDDDDRYEDDDDRYDEDEREHEYEGADDDD